MRSHAERAPRVATALAARPVGRRRTLVLRQGLLLRQGAALGVRHVAVRPASASAAACGEERGSVGGVMPGASRAAAPRRRGRTGMSRTRRAQAWRSFGRETGGNGDRPRVLDVCSENGHGERRAENEQRHGARCVLRVLTKTPRGTSLAAAPRCTVPRFTAVSGFSWKSELPQS